jgi:hypothetical protein
MSQKPLGGSRGHFERPRAQGKNGYWQKFKWNPGGGSEFPDSTEEATMGVGTIVLIILVILLLGGFSGIGGGPFYGTGYYGGGGLGVVIVILLILVLMGRL